MTTVTYDQELSAAAAIQLERHLADPEHEPLYLGCDAGPESDYSVGLPEEEDA
jgi:hypothetical protein